MLVVCSSIECLVDIQLVLRAYHISVHITDDACRYAIELKLDGLWNFFHSVSLRQIDDDVKGFRLLVREFYGQVTFGYRIGITISGLR